MSTSPRQPVEPSMADVIRVGRAAMLMEPLAEDFNSLLMVPPVRRIMIVAENLMKASSMNVTLEQMVETTGVMQALRKEGKARGAGEVVVPKAFIADFDRPERREAANV